MNKVNNYPWRREARPGSEYYHVTLAAIRQMRAGANGQSCNDLLLPIARADAQARQNVVAGYSESGGGGAVLPGWKENRRGLFRRCL